MKLEHKAWSRLGLITALLLAHLSFGLSQKGLSILPLKWNGAPQTAPAKELSGLTSHDVFRAFWAKPEWQSHLDGPQKKQALQLSKDLAALIDEISRSQLHLQQNLAEVWNENR